MAFFHAFSGCDTVSSFAGHGKKGAFDAWQSYPEVITELVDVATCMRSLEIFVVRLAPGRSSSTTSMNAVRKHLFAKKGRSVEAVLRQHVKRAPYQSGYVWHRSLQLQQEWPCLDQWG